MAGVSGLRLGPVWIWRNLSVFGKNGQKSDSQRFGSRISAQASGDGPKNPFPLVSGPMIVDIPPLPVRKRWLAVTTTRGLVRAKSPCLFILPLCGDRKSMVLHSLSLRRLTPKCQENRISALAEAENRPGGKNGGEAQQGQQVRAKVRQGAALEKDRPHRFHEVA